MLDPGGQAGWCPLEVDPERPRSAGRRRNATSPRGGGGASAYAVETSGYWVGGHSLMKFFGRGEELSFLTSLLSAAASERTQLALVVGDAGIGKSRLVSEFLSGVQEPTDVIANGHCVELFDHTLSFGPVIQVLRSLDRSIGAELFSSMVGPADTELSRLAPDLFPDAVTLAGDMADSGGRLFDAVSQVLVRVAAGGRLVLVIEDLHWADRATLDLIAYLARTLGKAPVLLVGTVRAEALSRGQPLRSWVAELVRLEHVHEIRLAGLVGDDLTAMAAELAGKECNQRLTEITERSEGNPFFLEELVGALAEPPGQLPQRLQDFLAGRIERLPDAAVAVVGVAAVAGPAVSHELLQAVVESPTTLSSGLRALVNENVLVPLEGPLEYQFRHALLREAVLLDLLPAERAGLHRRVALALEAEPELVEGGTQVLAPQLAAHWDGSGDRSRALAAAVTAGRVLAGMGVSAEARAYFDRALALWATVSNPLELTGLDQAQLLIEAAAASEDIGDYCQATDQLETARGVLPDDDGSGRRDLVTARLGWAKLMRGEEEGLQLLDAVIDGNQDGSALGWALAWRARHHLMETRFQAAGPDAERAAQIAEHHGDMRLLAYALITVGSVVGTTSDLDVDPLFKRARAAAAAAGALDLELKSYMNHSHVYNYRGRVAESYRMNVEILNLTKRPMPLWYRIQVIDNIMTSATQSGDFGLAREILSTIPDVVPDNHDSIFSRIKQGGISCLLGSYVEARAHLTSVGSSRIANQTSLELANEHIKLAWVQDEPPAALEAAVEAAPLVAECADVNWRGEFLLWALRGVALGQAHPDRLPAVQPLFDAVRDLPVSEVWHGAIMAEAEWVLSGPNPDLFALAAADFEDLPDVVEAQFCRVREVEAALALGERARAQAVIDATYPAVDAMGFRMAADLLLRLAARGGLNVPSPRATMAGRSHGLTRREVDVLRGLAQGLSNKQIASELYLGVRTVETHVSNVLAKLNVSSRSEAAVSARDLGILRKESRTT